MDLWEQLGTTKKIRRGEFVWRQDDPAGLGAILVEGCLGVECLTPTGERLVFTELRPGALLGEMSCLDGQPHSASVRALSDSELRIFKAAKFRALLKSEPELLWQVLDRQNQRVRYLSERLVKVATETIPRRLAYWLCEQPQNVVRVTHSDLAAQLGSTRESVSKALAKLRKQKLVATRRGEIEILARVRLAEQLTG